MTTDRPPRRQQATAPPRRRPSRPRSCVDGVGPHRGRRPGCPSSTTWSSSWAGTPAFDLTVHAPGRPARRRPPHGRGRRHRPRRAAWPRRWATRRASGASPPWPLPLDEALVEVALDLSGRPYLAYGLEFAPDTAGPRHAAVRPAAGRGVLAGLRHGGRPHPAHPPASRARTPTTCSRPASRAWPGACATRCASRGAASPPPRAACDRQGRAIAVLDYGIGNLRSAEKALQHLGRRRPPGRRSRRSVEAADAVVLPGVGAFGACAAGPARERAGATPRGARSTAGVPVLRGLRRLPAALRGLGSRARARPGLGVFAGTVAPLPAGVKHPQMQWNRSTARGRARTPAPLRGLGPRPWVYFVHSFAPPVGRRDRGGLRLRGPGGRAGRPGHAVGGAVPPREVGRDGPGPAGQLRRPGGVAPGVMELLPAIDLRGGAAVRLTQGDFDREARYGDPVGAGRRARRRRRPLDPRRRPRRGPHRRAARAGGAGRDRRPRRGASASTSRPAAGSAPRTTPRSCSSPGWPGSSWARPRSRTPRWRPAAPAAGPGGSRSASTTGSARTAWPRPRSQGWLAGIGPRRWPTCSTLWAGEPIGAVVATVVDRDGMLDGPGPRRPGRACWRRRRCRWSPRAACRAPEDLGRAGPARGRRAGALAGAIVGKALVEGRFSVEEGLAACAPSA